LRLDIVVLIEVREIALNVKKRKMRSAILGEKESTIYSTG